VTDLLAAIFVAFNYEKQLRLVSDVSMFPLLSGHAFMSSCLKD